MGMKQKLIDAIGFKRYRRLLVHTMRLASMYRTKRWINEAAGEVRAIVEPGVDCWFGYYDVPATSPDGTRQLYTRVAEGSEAAQICVANGIGERYQVAETRAWCWQMGCRAQWLDGERILFNDFDGDDYISRVVAPDGRELGRLPFPVYSLSADQRTAYYPDFEILGALRPGYGYGCKGGIADGYYDGSPNGIWAGDLSRGSSRLLLSMDDIRSCHFDEGSREGSHYVNHISASPFGDLIMFFHLWEDADGHSRNRVILIDGNGALVRIIGDFERASHYAWRDGSHLLLTVVSKGGCEYRLYDLESGGYEELGFLREDGHPTYVGDGLFITDTYPDHLGMQHLLLCSERNVIAEIATVYHNPAKVEERRCDLHPRYSAGRLSFDCVVDESREQWAIDIDFSKKTVAGLEACDRSRSGFAGVFRQLASTREAIPVKVMFNRVSNVAMNAHWDLARMLGAKGRINQLHYHNRLQRRYGVWISPKCMIGKRFHMMHLQGITIGSGVIIGDDCTIYQQVTLGKEKGKFPVIGNGVTIYAGAKVIGGVSVGDGAVVGANAVVTKDVPANAVVAGVPARTIGMRGETQGK